MLITAKGIYGLNGSAIDGLPFSDRPVTAADGRFGRTALVVDGNEVWVDDGTGWEQTAISEKRINCLIWLDSKRLLAGCAEARAGLVENGIRYLEGFDSVPDRKEWNTPWGGPPDVRSFAVAPDGTVYANIHVGWIVRSTDSGLTWQSVRTGLEKDVHQVATHPDYPEVVFAATAHGFHYSTNRGETFERTSEPMPYYYQRACAVFPGTDVFLCSTSRGPHGDAEALLFRSEDAGGSWSRVNDLPDRVASNIDTYQLAAGRDGTALVVVHDTEVWESDDCGGAWRRIAENLPKVYGFLNLN